MPSKKVFFKCNKAFVHEQIRSPEAIEALARGTRAIGSFFATLHSDRQGNGLTDEEIKLLMPVVLGISVNDLDFRKKVEGFYMEINTPVHYINGLELEIGLELDNSKPVTYTESVTEELPDGTKKTIIKYNTPLAFENYVAYRHGIAHPDVAQSPEAAKGNKVYKYYLEDPILVDKGNLKQIDLKDNAMALFAMTKTDPIKVKQLLVLMQLAQLLKKRPNEMQLVISNLSIEEQLMRLREVANDKPEEFIKFAGDKYLKPKYQLNEFLRVGLLKEAGSAILVPGSGEVLGATREQAVINLYDNPEMNQLLSSLKAQMLEKIG